MSQKTDNLIKLALVFFVSLLSFSIGTYVGKKYSDNQHKLALLEPNKETPTTPHTTEEFATEAAAQVEKNIPNGHATELTATEEKPAALTDSEVAKIAEEFASDEENTEEKIVTSIDPHEKPIGKINTPVKTIEKTQANSTTEVTKVEPAPKKTVTPAQTLTQSQALLVAKAKTVEEKPVANLEEQKVLPTPSDNESVREPASLPPKQEIVPIHYTVQIGSFPTETEATQLTKNLQNKGYKTSFIPAKVNGQVWYRVNVGLFGTIKEAQDYKKEFLEKTKFSSAIVQRVQH